VTYYDAFDTDWEDLDAGEATDRAYAIGVAERFGETHRDELQLVYDAVDTAYEKSMVELAYEEGRRDAKAAAADDDGAESFDEVWDDLVEGRSHDIDYEDVTDEGVIGGRDGLPESIDRCDMLDRPTPDTTDAIDPPDFLDR